MNFSENHFTMCIKVITMPTPQGYYDNETRQCKHPVYNAWCIVGIQVVVSCLCLY